MRKETKGEQVIQLLAKNFQIKSFIVMENAAAKKTHYLEFYHQHKSHNIIDFLFETF